MVFFYLWCLNHQFTPPPKERRKMKVFSSMFISVILVKDLNIRKIRIKKGDDAINITPPKTEMEQ